MRVAVMERSPVDRRPMVMVSTGENIAQDNVTDGVANVGGDLRFSLYVRTSHSKRRASLVLSQDTFVV